MSDNVRLQNLRQMTVQIRRSTDDAIVGTGIAVSTDGKVVTYAHVVEAAIGAHPRDANDAEIGVYFPQALGTETKSRRALVAKCFPQHDDDVVLLQLTEGASPLAPENIAVLGHAEKSAWHEFRSYGYRRLEKYITGFANGKILDCVECPEDQNVQCDPVQLESNQINQGMSGAAVLDVERNLVVGIVSETWFPDLSTKDRDSAWAVNARVLSLEPIGLPLQDEPYPMRAAPQPKTDVDEATRAVAPIKRYAWNNAPDVLPEWTGRNDLLGQITQDWLDPSKRVTGLIGFGGEGKSSLARKWVDIICRGNSRIASDSRIAPDSQIAPEGIFWWGFYENRSVDEFLEAALKWLSGGRIDPRAVPSSSLRAQIIGAMLGVGCYLFVLDGLEVMQHQEGDQYGLLQSNDLRDLLTYFARPDNQSFCLVTSRALLKKLGVKAKDDSALDKVVRDWDGHALTLSLLAAILKEQYDGDVAHIADLPAPTMNEPRYDRVGRVLRRYDEHLTNGEREFLKIFSAFRLPVHEDAFNKVFRPLLPSPRGRGDGGEGQIVTRLINYRILRFGAHERIYTTHPLIRGHYHDLLKANPKQEKSVHEHIKDYYLSIAGDTLEYPTLDDLKPLFEVVHHACEAGAYDEAFQIYRDRTQQGSRFIDVHSLGAYEISMSLMLEFFPGDVSRESQVSKPKDRSWILNAVGLRLMNLGRLREAVPFYERGNAMDASMQDWHNASIGYQNLAELHASLGALEASAEAVRQALDLSRKTENKQEEIISLAYQAWVEHLRGNFEKARSTFADAEKLAQETNPSQRYLISGWGFYHANHLRRIGERDYARKVTEANLEISKRNHWIFVVSVCHRILGDLDSDAGNHASACAHYDTALKIARSISYRPALIEALLARGRWQAKYMKDAQAAFSDLNEALNYAVEGGYLIYEADIRVALAWGYSVGSMQSAKVEVEHALRMSEEMGYYWGKVDAEEVLATLEGN
jgi:tetratricopeptide (TPR) repeat protein